MINPPLPHHQPAGSNSLSMYVMVFLVVVLLAVVLPLS